MTGLVCGNSQSKDPNAFFRFLVIQEDEPSGFELQESDIKPHHVCSRHFPNGNAKNDPTTTLEKRFASPIKKGLRARRAKGREAKRQLSELYSVVSPTPSSSRSVTPSTLEQPALTATVGEQLLSDYQVHELPVDDESDSSSLPAGLQSCSHPQTEVLVNIALLARVEYLEAENARLKNAHPRLLTSGLSKSNMIACLDFTQVS